MSVKYIGLDVHQATTVAAVVDGRGKLVMESIVETKASTLLEFLHGLRGELHVTLEEGTWAAWLHDVLQPHVQQLIICDPRKNKYLQQGSQNDKIESRKLAQLLRAGLLSPVYHGESGLRTLQEFTRSYLTLTQDLTRVMNRIKAVYRGRGIPCATQKVFNPHHRDEWLKKLREPGLRRRAERLYQQLDQLQPLRQQARREMLQESRRHAANRWLNEIPYVGSIRAAQLIALVQTPQRFRTKRQLWAYSGLAVRVQSSADYRFAQGQLQRNRNADTVRGLNNNRNPQLKYLFKSIALSASVRPGPLHDFYEKLLHKGMKPAMAQLTLARKIAAITLTIWKRGERFDPKRLNSQVA
jgi:transposase